MKDFTDNFERLEDIQGKYPVSTLVLRAQFVYMLQDQFRDLERDYRKISEMYVAEMEKAAKLEQRVRHEKRKRCLAMARWCASRTVAFGIDDDWNKVTFYDKWKERWREMADKFKEAK